MCGISGYINLDGRVIKSNDVNRKMLLAQQHRGPDDSGIRAFSLKRKNSIALSIDSDKKIDGDYEGIIGFNRLSILDVTPNGHQPMVAADNKVILTLNGEVYNAFDYKKELEEWGYVFRGTSDTEVVLALYLKYGLDKMLEMLNGMYAIVIIDLRIASIYCIRDRYGIKPLYYIYQNGLFAFSSEFKSFKYLDGFDFKLNRENVDEYLLFRCIINGTLIENIESLNPGCCLEISLERGLAARTYFDVNNYSRNGDISKSKKYYEQQLKDALVKSVRYQLISDVKVGCQLSGGIDSSLITYLSNKMDGNKSFESISVIFEDKKFSEEKYIDIVTNQLNIVSHKFVIDSNYYYKNIEKVAWHFESPLNHPSLIGIYLLSQKAKDYVTVLLSGEGADEIFGGYSRFKSSKYPYNLRLMLRYLRKEFPQALAPLTYFSSINRAILSSSFMPVHIANSIINDFNYKKATRSRQNIYKELQGSLFDKQVKYELKTYLPDLLIRQDKMSMAHSIENRVPFLDYDLVKLSFDIPEYYLLDNKENNEINNGKMLLKEIVSEIFGHDFAYRNKVGFDFPLRDFLSSIDMKQYIKDDVLPKIQSRDLMNSKLISKWVDNLASISSYELGALWIVISFEIWASLYI
jgi:asparagine synthase (glutamine-hydrolysing)